MARSTSVITVMENKSTPCVGNHTQSSAFKVWLRGLTRPPAPHPPYAWGHGSRQFNWIDHEDRIVCRSPRRERSISALCRWCDGNHAAREFDLADLVLRPKRQSRRSPMPNTAQKYYLQNTQPRPEQDRPRAGGSDQALDQTFRRDPRRAGARGGKSRQLCCCGAQGACCR